MIESFILAGRSRSAQISRGNCSEASVHNDFEHRRFVSNFAHVGSVPRTALKNIRLAGRDKGGQMDSLGNRHDLLGEVEVSHSLHEFVGGRSVQCEIETVLSCESIEHIGAQLVSYYLQTRFESVGPSR